MSTLRVAPLSAAQPFPARRAALCACFLCLLLAARCAPKIHAQNSLPTTSNSAAPAPPAQAHPAPAQPPAADPDADQDTLDTTPPTDETEDGSNPDPAQPAIVLAPRLKGDSVESADDAPILMPVAASAGGNAQRQQINNECANLLFLAMTLKAQVDKSNMNVLSVPVVRSAAQIEQLARKMREEMRPALSSRK